MAEQRNSFAALRKLARDAAQAEQERCDLCGAPIANTHRHLLQLESRQVLCACRACSILFDAPSAGAAARSLIPTRYIYLSGFDMPDADWESLRIPVNMAFFSYHTPASRMVAMYPSPAGATESLLSLETWENLESRNPVLKQLQPDVEALLVNRVREARDYYLVPIDECYRLVGLIRMQWRGLSGGREVWETINQFFADLNTRSGGNRGAHA